MSKTQRFVWELYFLVVLLFNFRTSYNFFDPHSDVYLYFQIFTAFDPTFQVIYLFNFFQIVLNLIHLLPLALFIYGKRLFPVFIWQVLFGLKVVFDIIGHTFEMKILSALWHDDPLMGAGVFISSTAIYIPAYVAVFTYAFLQNRLKLEDL